MTEEPDGFADALEHGDAGGPVDTRAQTVRGLLAQRIIWEDPAPEVEHDVASAIQSEIERVNRSRGQKGGSIRWILGAAAAAVIALVVGLAVTSTEPRDVQQLALDGTELAPRASAVATIEGTPAGVLIELEVEGLDPAPEGSYYQGWLRYADGDLVSVGTFHMRGGDGRVGLWSGVEPADYPTLSITLQLEGGGTDSSGDVVLRGTLD